MFSITNNIIDGSSTNFTQFVHRFDDIVNTHIELGRAKAFAFIFYDYNDINIKKILKEGYQELDRLSGKDLTVFYFDSKSRKGIAEFNNIVVNSFELDENITLPCIIFFKVANNEVSNIKVVNLIETNFLALFYEINETFRKYINNAIRYKPKFDKKPKMDIKIIALEQFINVIFSSILKKFVG